MRGETYIEFVRSVHRRGRELLDWRVLDDYSAVEEALDSSIDELAALADKLHRDAPFPMPADRDWTADSVVVEAIHHMFQETEMDIDSVQETPRIESKGEGVHVSLGYTGAPAMNWYPLFTYLHERFMEIISIFSRLRRRIEQTVDTGGMLLRKTNIIVNMAKSCRDAVKQVGYQERLVNNTGDYRAVNDTLQEFSTWTADQLISE